MEEKAFKKAVETAKSEYFATADAALERKNLTQPSEESFRKLLADGKKNVKNKTKKAAS